MIAIERIPLTKQIPVTNREWALFALRWLIPVGLALMILPLQATLRSQVVAELGLIAVSAITNLVILLLILSHHWSRVVTVSVIVFDALTAVIAVAILSPSVVWVGLIPVAVSGFYFTWIPGLLTGLGISLGMLALAYLQGSPGDSLPSVAVGILALPVAGPLVAWLSHDDAELNVLRERFRERSKRVEQVARLAQEQMHVIYEMAEVLAKSKLDPQRVLASVVSFAIDSLERMGVPPPLFALVLLFADGEDNQTVMRVARASATVPPGDTMIELLGQYGAIDRTLRLLDTTVINHPASDPELGLFECMRQSRSAMCLPLRAGDEVYGVMIVASRVLDIFKDTHIELMAAVTNQVGASLNNVRLYVTLLEERDRIVQIEKDARAQLASNLHDGPTQGVAAITMRLNYIRKLIEKRPESALDELYALEDMARRTTKEIRHMLFELRPKALDSGLRSGLEQLAIKMKETYDQDVRVFMNSDIDTALDLKTTQTLFSICSEVITNARKHARANEIIVRVNTDQNMLILNVSDDGVGFDVSKALADSASREGHLGLTNLQERAALLEGALHIDSAPGKGTRTTVVIPLDVIRGRREEESTRAADRVDSKVVARVVGM